MITNIFLIILLCFLLSNLVNCFVSFFSGPFMFVYSILRTIDGMVENIEHISNSMDLSLQSFLSKHILNDENKVLYKPFTLNADYHGSVYPSEMSFHPTLPNCKYDMKYYSRNDIEVENNPYLYQNVESFNLTNIYSNSIMLNFTYGIASNDHEKQEIPRTVEYRLEDKQNYFEDIDPHYFNTIMIKSETTDSLRAARSSEFLYRSAILDSIYNKDFSELHSSFSFRSASPEQPDSTKESLSENFENDQISDMNFDVNKFRLYTYYTTHYLFQITSIFSMGISLHTQYRRKSRKRKLHLVR